MDRVRRPSNARLVERIRSLKCEERKCYAQCRAACGADPVAFLLALTDDRVLLQQAPFDHPQLFVPDGDSPPGTDNMVEIPAVGTSGSQTPVQRFLNLNPFAL